MTRLADIDMPARLGELARRVIVAGENCAEAAPSDDAYDQEKESIWRQVNGYHDGLMDAWRLLTDKTPPAETLSTRVSYHTLIELLKDGEKSRQELEDALGQYGRQICELVYRANRAHCYINTRRERSQKNCLEHSTYYYSLEAET